ncbi:hypothetical protein GF345_02360, partial [Candidatus Woesearchaeota archaeon]|nr:hypothetical protein [Candidatus Woesearchaeota archaeon]
MTWPFSRKDKLKDDISKLLNIKQEEVNVEKMTEDVRIMLENIMKMEREGKILLEPKDKKKLAEIVKQFEKDVSAA